MLSHHSFACSNSLAHDVLSSWESSQQTVTSPEVETSLKQPTSCGQAQDGATVIYLWNITPRESTTSHACVLSCVRLHAIPGTIVCQAPLSKGFSRQEYWSGVPLPTPRGIFPTQGLNPRRLCLPAVIKQVLHH